MKTQLLLLLPQLLLCLCLLYTHTIAQTKSTNLLLTHVNLIDGTGRGLQKDVSILLTGNTIKAIGRNLTAGKGTIVVEGKGRYVIPGLWDMHAHVLIPQLMDWQHPLLLANGVTSVRDCGADPEMGLKVRREREAGQRLAPSIYYAGPMLDGSPMLFPQLSAPLDQPEQVGPLLAYLATKEVDFFVTQSLLPKPVLEEVVRYAKKLGKPVTMQNPLATTWREAARAGVSSFETVGGFISATYQDGGQATHAPIFAAVQKGEIDLVNFNPLGTFYFEKPATRITFHDRPETEVTSYNQARTEALAKELARSGVHLCPQLNLVEDLATYDQMPTDPLLKYVPKPVLEMWNQGLDFTHYRKDRLATGEQYLRAASQFVQTMHQAGVPILAGTHTILSYVFPGFDLHRELYLLTQAGLSPEESIRAATYYPAKVMGKLHQTGTVEAGKAADLLLLEANPLEDIGNTKKIYAVVKEGKLLDKAQLEGMLRAVEQMAASSKTK